MTKTMDELRRSTEVCEHGSQERKCIVCESLAQDVEIERLGARVEDLEGHLVRCGDVKGALMESGKIQAQKILELDTENERLHQRIVLASRGRMRIVPD